MARQQQGQQTQQQGRQPQQQGQQTQQQGQRAQQQPPQSMQQRQPDQQRDALRGVSQNDNSALAELLRIQVEENVEASGLDARSYALANLGALVAMGGDIASFAVGVDRAVSSGASPDEVLGVLVAVAPTVGVPRIVAAAPEIAAALDIELDATTSGGGGSQSSQGRSGQSGAAGSRAS